MQLLCDAVFEGGGVKGIGLVGGLTAVEQHGYQFANLAGSSAGAIISALLAVGYTAAEIKAEMLKMDFEAFKQKGVLDQLGSVGKALSIGINFGIYSAGYFEEWMEGLLAAKGKTRFGDILTGDPEMRYRYRFQAIASDITDQRMLVLPGALLGFGYDPDEYSIAKAVRMSMSIPVFFEPFRLQDNNRREHIIVDGGVLSNYPVWLLDDGMHDMDRPTFGFKFNDNAQKVNLKSKVDKPIGNIIDFTSSLIRTMVDAHDSFHISQSSGDFDRTILISTAVKHGRARNAISATDFDITQGEMGELFDNGYQAGRSFLETFDFDAWKAKYRPVPNQEKP